MKKGIDKKYLLFGVGAIVVLAIIISVSMNLPKEVNTEDILPNNSVLGNTNAVLYEPRYSFINFTDPKENAFSVQVPDTWEVSTDSGIIRPYIDAGIFFSVTSSENQGFFYRSPYRVYTVPNSLLDFAGFTEGKYYDPSGGFSTPMLVKKYTEAKDFLNEYIQQLNVDTKILQNIERPDLINQNPDALITKQSSAEITYTSNGIIFKVIAYNYLVEFQGTGIWMASMFGYHSPENLFNETEYLVLKSAETFRVNPQWAIRESQEVNKRLGIISSTQDSISDAISSSFEYRSNSQDRINHEWSKTTLGVEEVYNPETGDTRIVDSGANYYWMDNQNRIYGTETDESPRLNEDMTPLEIKKEV